MKNIAIILGAGKSTRCGFDKILREQNGISNLEQCIRTFSNSEVIDDIWVVLSENQKNSIGHPLSVRGSRSDQAKLQRGDRIKGIIEGGKERFFSVKNAIEHCQEYYDENVRLIFHNAANPNLSKVDLEKGIKLAEKKKNVIFGYFTPNSIKKVVNGKVVGYLDREKIFETQTPQISDLKTFQKALDKYDKKSKVLTLSPNTFAKSGLNSDTPKDEAELLDLIGEKIYVYECDPSNRKVTYASDFVTPQSFGQLPLNQEEQIRIGIGEDSHRFSKKFDPQKPFRLGGIDVSGNKLTSDGNSDGDVILHALCNALLSAHGDKTFDPIAAPICKSGDTRSVSYLQAILQHLGDIKIQQVLISLEGLQPKIAPYHDKIQENLTKLLTINTNQIGLTYTTGEKLNDCGKGLGIRSFVMVISK